MKTLLALPSKDRVKILEDNALKWVPSCGVEWAVFVEPQDHDKYINLVAPEHLVVMDQNDQGLGYAKNFIKRWAKERGYTHIFKMDDDVRGFTNYRTKLSPEATAEYVGQFMTEIERAFEEYPRVKCVSFPYSFEMYEKKQWEVTKRVQTAYIVEIDSMYVNPKISVYEDFAAGLSILVEGGLILRYGLAGIDMGVKVGGGTGGHQAFDRYDKAMNELDEMRKLYPPLNFRKVPKPWKVEPDLASVDLPKKR